MLKLSGNIHPIGPLDDIRSALYTVTTDPLLPIPMRGRFALLTDHVSATQGYGVQLVNDDSINDPIPVSQSGLYRIPAHFNYLKAGDIVYIDGARKFLHTLFRKNSFHNTVLLTEQCNHYCLMCSQPPKEIDDSHLLQRAFELINLIPNEVERIGFSGGEPTLYGDRLIELIRQTKLQLPNTYIDLLTNGRRFKDLEFARRFGKVKHPHCTVAIPLYSDDPVRHDYVVQAKGAFDETIQGILNLKRFGQTVEIRIVIHKQTIDRLVQTCQFICRNLLFVDHVALMGLEITGFTRPNLDILWIDPYDYKDILSEAVGILTSYRMNVSVYNHQLCVINSDVESNYRKSISDWKNEYLEKCAPCVRKSDCGGFFSSSKMYRHSDHIQSFV